MHKHLPLSDFVIVPCDFAEQPSRGPSGLQQKRRHYPLLCPSSERKEVKSYFHPPYGASIPRIGIPVVGTFFFCKPIALPLHRKPHLQCNEHNVGKNRGGVVFFVKYQRGVDKCIANARVASESFVEGVASCRVVKGC